MKTVLGSQQIGLRDGAATHLQRKSEVARIPWRGYLQLFSCLGEGLLASRGTHPRKLVMSVEPSQLKIEWLSSDDVRRVFYALYAVDFCPLN